jgi:hypothetical protein
LLLGLFTHDQNLVQGSKTASQHGLKSSMLPPTSIGQRLHPSDARPLHLCVAPGIDTFDLSNRLCRSVAAALLAALQQLRAQSSNAGLLVGSSGTFGQAGTLLSNPATTAGPAAAEGGSATARSFKSTASGFSFGSDAVVECWHAGSGVDVSGLTQLLAVVLRVLRKLEWWRCMLELGEGQTNMHSLVPVMHQYTWLCCVNTGHE